MLVELSLLPPHIVQQILQIQQGRTVQFTHKGQIVANIVPAQSSYEMLMAMDYPDEVADIEEENFIRQSSLRMNEGMD
ncbi:hypothetical protein [Alysiella filiformis]|uniref:Uncharacterized protein n=1 Tax=Alysiella filiformis DSM 16848 TaxID=1120981 RepID=A0A286E417_9NEIS|nr:hypothetical protein [Alysiella filiformis]QMT31034.1 hypothetical protein H3L97_09965 [Alysiella filiformis]UBQ55977.1 hypothetical protein JF568_10505 [Alysiella filiformis DSM 16848]SOD65624.1 hypothetical protein SAMN02746062_00356 [Alysiella filiformis DSM 16848]